MNVEDERIRRLASGLGFVPNVDGPILAAFNAAELAQLIENEVSRIHGVGKVSLHMDPIDAMMLAQVLRRKG